VPPRSRAAEAGRDRVVNRVTSPDGCPITVTRPRLFAYATVTGFGDNVPSIGRFSVPFLTVADRGLGGAAVLAWVAGILSVLAAPVAGSGSQAGNALSVRKREYNKGIAPDPGSCTRIISADAAAGPDFFCSYTARCRQDATVKGR
jgi:hypothetical protein